MYRGGDLKGALGAFREALGKAPDNFWAHYFTAVCRLNLDRPARGRDEPHGLPGDPHRLPLGLSTPRLRPRPARRDGRLRIRLRPGPRAGDDHGRRSGPLCRLRQSGESRGVAGPLARGIADLERAVALKPDQSQGHANLAFGYQKQGNLDKAIVHLDRAIALAPSAGLYLRRARIRLESGDAASASRDFDLALRLERPGRAVSAQVRASNTWRQGVLPRRSASSTVPWRRVPPMPTSSVPAAWPGPTSATTRRSGGLQPIAGARRRCVQHPHPSRLDVCPQSRPARPVADFEHGAR